MFDTVHNETGIYRARPIEWVIEEYEGKQTKALRIKFEIIQRWDGDGGGGGTWSAEFPGGYVQFHRAFIIGKEGNLNERAIRSLTEAGLWDGNFESLAQDPNPHARAIVDVRENEYNGRVSYRIEWVNPDAEKPRAAGGPRTTDASVLQQLQARFGAQTRAMGGGSTPQPAGGDPF